VHHDGDGPGGDHHDHDHAADHAALYETWSCRPTATFAASALRALLRAMPAGVLRLKGIVRSDEHGWSELQFAGRHGSLRRALAAPAEGAAALVAIGLTGALPRAALDAAFLRPSDTFNGSRTSCD
jgi:G3E family GTPase